MVVCAAVTVIVCCSVGETEGNVVMCAAVTVMVCCSVGRRKEMESVTKRGFYVRSQNCEKRRIFSSYPPVLLTVRLSVCMK